VQHAVVGNLGENPTGEREGGVQKDRHHIEKQKNGLHATEGNSGNATVAVKVGKVGSTKSPHATYVKVNKEDLGYLEKLRKRQRFVGADAGREQERIKKKKTVGRKRGKGGGENMTNGIAKLIGCERGY